MQEIIEGTDQKIIVFSQFKGMLDAVEHRLAKQDIESVRIDGETPMGERSNIVDRFQNDPGVQVFLGTIRAAGVGITLTASSTVVFLDLDWTPALNEQAEDRAHRIGQTDNVQVIRIKAEDTVDLIHIDPTLRFKREMIAQVLGKGGE